MTPILPLLVNPLTPLKLMETIIFQVGFVGGTSLVASLYLIPRLSHYQGMHPITDEEKTTIRSNAILRLVFGKARQWYDHVYYSLASTAIKTAALLILVLTLFTLLTDVGWLRAWQQWGTNWENLLLLARAGGTPNGAHLLSYIPLPVLGAWVAWKYRKNLPGNRFIGDVYQGIFIIGFGVAIHELLWIIFYFIQYYAVLGLYAGSNFIEDIFFSVMCFMLVAAFWKYPFRTIPIKIFVWPSLGYFVIMFIWWGVFALPVSTINNYQFGSGIYEITKWWQDPFVNAVEIFSWIYMALTFWFVIWWHDRH